MVVVSTAIFSLKINMTKPKQKFKNQPAAKVIRRLGLEAKFKQLHG